jgi:DNA-binding NtrC family response regulator
MPATAAVQRAPVRQILVLSADDALWNEVSRRLRGTDHILRATSIEEANLLFRDKTPDIILLDSQCTWKSDGIGAVLPYLRNAFEDVVLVVLASRGKGHGELLAAGADEVVTLPLDPLGFRPLLERAFEKRRLEAENRRLRAQVSGRYSFHELLGGSDGMRRVYDAICRLAPSNTTVAIRGESGTGKELVARAIVAMSPRKDRPFVSVNCAALPDTLIETELFGHEKGAFTGAHVGRPGQIEMAHSGTLFLDEIGTLGLPLQSKLLRVLEDCAVQRLGARNARHIDFRLITATNEDLETLVNEGRFREDLYYRIHVVPIFVPPLRERQGDIPLLIDHFLRLYCTDNRAPLKRMSAEAMEILEEGAWPGNVRELENLVQRLVLMVEGTMIRAEDLPQQILVSSAARQNELLIPENGLELDEEMQRIEAAYLKAALQRTGGRKVAAAALLRLDPRRMGYLCRKYKI